MALSHCKQTHTFINQQELITLCLFKIENRNIIISITLLVQETDKVFLAESTGLDQKQINNWFINQRKRHWKPSEDMQLAVMDSISGQFYNED